MSTGRARTSTISWGPISPLVIVLGLMGVVAAAVPGRAQDLEPRAYSNTPIGLKFVLMGYGYIEGNVSFDPSVPITDAHLHTNSTVFGFAQSFNVFGRSAKFDVVTHYTWLDGNALFQDQRRRREISGWGDPLFRFSMNFYGAPALSLKDFANYRQNIILGFSLRVSPPLGQYDSSKLVNIGTNRWSIKPELGISKAWGPWIVDAAPSVTFYTNNTDFLNGSTLSQEPLYAVQAHLIRSFHSGVWVALDTTYFKGARTTTDGVKADNMQSNSRGGITIALPVNRQNSIKLYGSRGTSSRTGSRYDGIGLAWQFRWGGGIN